MNLMKRTPRRFGRQAVTDPDPPGTARGRQRLEDELRERIRRDAPVISARELRDVAARLEELGR